MSAAYYNEIDDFAADWLRVLISKKLIAPGDVDTRDIKDVCPDDLKPYTQHHFFAGIGGWSYAARLAGWPDDRPLATGSCPCQPFSAAGRSGGFVDERHLWPHQHYLIQQCRFPVWAGEQVASPDGLAWLDLVCADMEATGYAGGSLDLCSAGFGSPNIRQRLYLAFHDLAGLEHTASAGSLPGPHGGIYRGEASSRPRDAEFERPDAASGLADLHRDGRNEARSDFAATRGNGAFRNGTLGRVADLVNDGRGQYGGCMDRAPGTGERTPKEWERIWPHTPHGGATSRVANSKRTGLERHAGDGSARPAPVNGWWAGADWLLCRNPNGGAEWRPAEPGSFPLAHGFPNRVGLLRGYGNAINPQVASEFLKAVMAEL